MPLSQRKVKQRYLKMVALNCGITPNGVNCYSCSCGVITKTTDEDAGTTPLFNTLSKLRESIFK